MNISPIGSRRQQGGFSLIDVLLALGVVILISGITLTGIRRTNESNQAKAVGEQIKMEGTALNTYLSLRYDTLVDHVPGTDDIAGVGTPDDPGPRTCVCTVGTGACADPGNIKMCTITAETLRRNGLLPSNYSGVNAFGSTSNYRIRVQPQGGSVHIVDGMVWTNDPYTMEGEIRYDLLGQAMMVAGADSGMTRSVANNVEGFNGAWTENQMGVNQLGVLAYRAGYNTFGYAAYLRLSGGEMLGPIDMGGERIFNASDIKAQNLAADRLYVQRGSNAIIFTDPANMDIVNDSGITGVAAADPRIESNATGNLVLRADQPIQFLQSTTGSRANVEVGDMNATGVVDAQGLRMGATAPAPATYGISAQGNIVTSQDVIASSVQAGSGAGNVYASLHGGGSGGSIYFNANSAGDGGTVRMGYDNANNRLTTVVPDFAIHGNLNVHPNSGTGGNITATGTVRSGTDTGGITIDGTATATLGAACNANTGTIRRTTAGDIVACVNDSGGTSRWRSATTSTSTVRRVDGAQTCTGVGNADGNGVTISCAAGETAISGGYRYASGAKRAAPQSSYRVNPTSWYVQAGPTWAYTGTETQQTCWDTYVICTQ